MKKKEFTNEQLQDIFYKYQEDFLSAEKIGKYYGVSKTVILRILHENNIPLNVTHHKYKADYRKFAVIDTPEKAYWLGFVAADGCVYVRPENATVRISLHKKDEGHLEKFKKFMNSNVRITEFMNASGFSAHTPSPMCAIAYNSKEMAQDFIDKGIIPRKSWSLEPPKIQEEFYLPYIMGYFDGDGTIYKTNKDTVFVMGFIGTKPTIMWINEYLGMNATLEQRIAGSDTYYIRCGGTHKPYNFLKKIYDSVDIHLDRKYDLFKELEAKCRP